MQTQRQWLNYQELELIATPESNVSCQTWTVRSRLAAIWHGLQSIFAGNAQVRIRLITDASGQCWWNVYDPSTHQSAQLASEAELRTWLDKRFTKYQAHPLPNRTSYRFFY
jgi:hypothetical protein